MKRSIWTGLFLLVLCSKIYFIGGFFVGTHLPAAPLWVVAFRDLCLGVFMAAIGWQVYQHPQLAWLRLRSTPHLRILSLTIGLGFLIYGVHVVGQKTFFSATQHYLRNVLAPLMLFPLGWILFGLGKGFPNIRGGLKAFAVINILASYPQFVFTEYMWVNRPTGLVGDPILNTSFILLGLWLFFQDRHQQKSIFTWGVPLFALPIIYTASSLSSLVAFVSAVVIVFVLELSSQGRPWSSLKKQILFFSSFLIFGFIAFEAFQILWPQNSQSEYEHGITAKAGQLYDSLFCQENCGPKEWFVEGRLRSNLFPIQLFSENPNAALIGDWSSPDYHRVDSLWASLAANWGLLFLGFYLTTFLFLPLRQILRLQRQETGWDKDQHFSILLFIYFWIFSLMNTGIYKYPLNLVFYLSLIFLWTDFSKRSSQ